MSEKKLPTIAEIKEYTKAWREKVAAPSIALEKEILDRLRQIKWPQDFNWGVNPGNMKVEGPNPPNDWAVHVLCPAKTCMTEWNFNLADHAHELLGSLDRQNLIGAENVNDLWHTLGFENLKKIWHPAHRGQGLGSGGSWSYKVEIKSTIVDEIMPKVVTLHALRKQLKKTLAGPPDIDPEYTIYKEIA